MDDLLLLLIFSYPGAVADMTYAALAKEKTFYRDISNTARVARGFFLSVIITIVTMLITIPDGGRAHTLTNWLSLLKASDLIWRYSATTLGISVLLGILWYAFAMLQHEGRNLWAKITKRTFKNTQYGQTWYDVVRQPKKVDLRQAVIVVYNAEGKRINCGFPFALPNDIRKEHALALSNREWVELELDKDQDNSLIDAVLVTYSDLQNGYKIEVCHAPKLWEHVYGKRPEPPQKRWQLWKRKKK